MQYRATEPEQKNIANAFINRAKDIYHQESFSCIRNPASKLRTYGLLKHVVGREEYLIQIKNTKLRQKLTKFRLSNHKLMIEVGRHMRPIVNKEDRICPLCHLEVEDEIHFMTRCKIYKFLRKPILDHCEELRPQFKYYSAEEQFIFIMSNPLMMGNVSRYLDGALKEREIYLDVCASINSILAKIPENQI